MGEGAVIYSVSLVLHQGLYRNSLYFTKRSACYKI